MSPDIIYWVGLAVAVCFGLCGCVIAYHRNGQALRNSQAELIEQKTISDLANKKSASLQTEVGILQSEIASLRVQLSAQTATLMERETSHEKQLKWAEESRIALVKELESLGQKLLKSSGQELEATNQKSLDTLLKPFAEKINQFQSRVNQVHTDMIRNSASLTEQIKNLEALGVTMSGEAHNLARALKGDKKLVGNWGEAQLETTLELAGLRRGEHFDAQVLIKDEHGDRYMPDFVIRLPEGKSLIIDSKVSLVDYERAVSADSDVARSKALEDHAKAVRNHIESLSAKNYASLPGMESPDFVLMFMPVEPAYIEVMRSHRELFNQGYQKNVVLVSHTTLMPILRTVANLWMIEHSNEEAREISERAGDIYNTVCLLGDHLLGLGTAITGTAKKYNDTLKTVHGKQGLLGKVDRFQSLSQRANKIFPKSLAPIHPNVDKVDLSERGQSQLGKPATEAD